MNKALFIPAVIIGLLVGCRHQENTNQLKAISQCLQKSNEIVQADNWYYYEAMVMKLKDPLTSREATIWALRANKVKERTDNINILIENLKSELLKQSNSLKKANAPIVEQLYETNGDGYELLNKLVAFKQ